MNDTIVKLVKLRPSAVLPAYQTEHAAGMDIHACIDEPVVLQPMERKFIPAGFSMELPIGFEAQIRARSGLSIKHGITMINGVGTIDADYRGEVGALVVNLGSEPFVIEPGMRIVQMVVTRHEHVAWSIVDSLTNTKRGEGGYGSTGMTAKIDRTE